MNTSKTKFLVLIIISIFLVSIIVVQLFSLPIANSQPKYEIIEAFPNISFNQPVGIYDPFDGTNRLFVVSQSGLIHVFENLENVINADVFLDIRDRIIFGGEQGLLGLAFHPNFSTNGYFFVDYVADNPRRTIIARYSVSENDPSLADKNSESVVIEINQPYSNHNGGQIAFGPDGYLYVSLGDGGSGGDPAGNGQNLATLLGSILRIDVNQPNGIGYDIPNDNPFFGNTEGYREEIFAYGFRNPWRFSLDSLTGMLWVGDVGQNRFEEIDIVEKGKNYGWNIMEASSCYSPSQGCDKTGLELPIYEYGRDLGISVIGGIVYRGTTFSELVGSYIYGDYGSGRIWALKYDGINDPVNSELIDANLNIASFGTDSKNSIYICSFDNKIYKLTSNNAVIDIGIPTHFPPEPFVNQSVEISVSVTATNEVREVLLSYSIDTTWANLTMQLTSENTYSVNIPAMPEGTNVKYRITVYDSMNNFITKDNLGNYFSYTVIPEFSTLNLIPLSFIAVMSVIFLRYKIKTQPKKKD